MGFTAQRLIAPRWAAWSPGPIVIFVLLLTLLPLGFVTFAGFLAHLGESNLLLMDVLNVAVSAGLQALGSTALTFVVGVPLTYLLSRFRFIGRETLRAVLTLPFLLPTVVSALALRQLFDSVIEPGIALLLIGHVFVNVAVVVQIVGPVWEQIDQRLLWQAQALGAKPLELARDIVFPLLRPNLRQAAGLVFVYCFSSLGLLLILGGGNSTLESRLVRQISVLLDFGGAALTALVQLILISLVLIWSSRRSRFSFGLTPTPLNRTRLSNAWNFVMGPILIAVFLAPLVALMISSVQSDGELTLSWWGLVFNNQPLATGTSTLSSVFSSLQVAFLTALISALLTSLVAIAVVTGRNWAQRVAVLPIAVSSVTVGLGLLLIVGRLGLNHLQLVWLLPFAQTSLALPVAVGLAVGILKSAEPRLTWVAASLGANDQRAFLGAFGTLIARAALLSGGVAFAISLGEYGAASFLSSSQAPTLPVLLMHLASKPGAQSLGTASALSILLSLLAALTIWFTNQWRRGVDR